MCLSRSASEKLLMERAQAAEWAVLEERNGRTAPSSPPSASPPPASPSGTPPSSTAELAKLNGRKHRKNNGLEELLAPTDEDDLQNEQLRWREFGLVYIAYMGFLLSRKNYGFWLPSVIAEHGYSKGQAGLIGSSMEITYGTCSFINGVVIDSRSPKYLLVGALLFSALVNVCVAQTSSLHVLIALWVTNGAVQSVGWPSVTNVFLSWFPDPKQRGAWYSLLSTCQNAGAALVPLLVSASVSLHGWRAALYAPATTSSAVAILLLLFLYGSPAAVHSSHGRGYVTKAQPRNGDLALTMRQQVFFNKSLWLMAVSYFGVSMIRTCLQDWTSLFLAEAKGLPFSTAARCLFLWELGGFGGSLAAGAISDRLFAGRRGPVVCLCCALLVPSFMCLSRLHHPLLVQLTYLWLGVCAFPVHVLLGLFSREVVSPSVSSTAGGFVKMIAQIGGACAGYPLGRLQQTYGWDGVLAALCTVSIAAAAAALPLWKVTAAIRIAGRNGTVQDFSAMQRKASKKSLDKLQ